MNLTLVLDITTPEGQRREIILDCSRRAITVLFRIKLSLYPRESHLFLLIWDLSQCLFSCDFPFSLTCSWFVILFHVLLLCLVILFPHCLTHLSCFRVKSLNNNEQNQFFWACKNEHPQQTIVLTKTAGEQLLLSSDHCYWGLPS